MCHKFMKQQIINYQYIVVHKIIMTKNGKYVSQVYEATNYQLPVYCCAQNHYVIHVLLRM